MRLRSTVPVLLSALALVAAGCGDDEEEAASGGATSTTETAPTTPAETAPAEAAPSESESGGAAAGGEVSTDLDTKPTIPKPTGEPPSELEVNDIVEGSGPAAKEGDTLQVRYVGALFDTGEEFDASWNGGTQTFPVTLGEGGVIPGWEQGLEGMKAGGRRELVIPPDLGYGPEGNGPIPPNATLVFVVDLVEIA
jgi:FKBP-type peptidyl-prolyl cis-trans isomerase